MALSTRERKLIGDLGSNEETYQSIAKFRKDVEQLAKRRSQLIKQYPDRWIAFYGGNIISVSNTLDKLLQFVESKGLDSRKVVTQYLDTKKRTLIL